jgi:hypothetical protein
MTSRKSIRRKKSVRSKRSKKDNDSDSNDKDTGFSRKSTDKFYTRKSVVDMCIKELKKRIKFNKTKDLIIEPSAGNGAFIEPIKKLCDNHIFIDLYPEHRQIIKMDYLKFAKIQTNEDSNNFRKIHVIGNPPYGKHSSLAIKFIKASCEFCDTIAFILPRSFKKDHLKKIIPIKFPFDLRKNYSGKRF